MQGPLIDTLARQGVTRRTFLKYCATLASMMALPPSAGLAMAEAMAAARRPSVIWLPFQECTGCTESITRSHSPTHRRHDFRHDLARLSGNPDGRGGFPGRGSAAQRDEGQHGQVPAHRRRLDSARSGRRVFLHCRTLQSGDPERSRRGRGSDHCHGLLCRLTAAFRKPIRIRPVPCRCPTSSRTNPSSTFRAVRPFRR